MADDRTVRKLADALRAAAPPDAEVILFGSHARGTARADSDVDFLVVEPDVTDPCQEAFRLREALRPALVPIDIVVVSRRDYEYWRETPNTVHNEAACEGKVLAGVAWKGDGPSRQGAGRRVGPSATACRTRPP